MNTLPALPGLNAGRFGFLWGGGAAQHLQNQIRTGLGCARSSSMPSERVSPFLVNQKAGRQASQESERIRIAGLGILQVRKRGARMGRNPATGEAIKIKASKKVAFRAAKDLKMAV